MSFILPINIENLLSCSGVESARIEFKGRWDEKTTAPQVLKTIAAFAYDLQNLNGGYIIIGVNENKGCAVLPPCGIAPEKIDTIQKWIRGNCNHIDPEYQPVFSPEMVNGKHILVLWVPGSDIRPHSPPDGEKEQMSNIIQDQPEDSSYEEILKELAFALMIDRGMASINWAAEGERWLNEIYTYIFREIPATTVKVVEAIYSKVDLLKTFPYLGSRYDPESEDDIRILLYGHYRIAYLVKSYQQIDILGFFHTALKIEQYL